MWSLVLFFFFIYNVFSDDPTKGDDLDDDFYNDDANQGEGYKSHSEIKTKWQFLNRNSLPIEQASYSSIQLSPSKIFYQIPFNTPTKILINLRNIGEKTFNITAITGYLHAAHRFSFYVQNYTDRNVIHTLAAHSEISFEYRFQPWFGLSLVDYVFSCDLLYNYNDIKYKTKFVNTTINIYDPSSGLLLFIDFEFIFMLISIIIFWLFIFILFYELYYIPNQIAQGKQPLSTQDQIIFAWNTYIKGNYNNAKAKILNKPNSKQNNNSNSKPKKQNDWLSGTSMSKKKKKKK